MCGGNASPAAVLPVIRVDVSKLLQVADEEYY
jgi:hypothetical protein